MKEDIERAFKELVGPRDSVLSGLRKQAGRQKKGKKAPCQSEQARPKSKKIGKGKKANS
jgi:hypothetical protein